MIYKHFKFVVPIILACITPMLLIAQITSDAIQSNGSFNDSDQNQQKKWSLVFHDKFSTSGTFDESKWTYSPRGNPAWAKFLTPSPAYAFQKRGNLNLRMDDAMIQDDQIPFHAGGIQTAGKFNLTYGRIEVRAKFNQGKGSWPAIWMMPEAPIYGSWPASGEIDIMEHVNRETVVHQTIHNSDMTDAEGGSKATHKASYRPNKFNTYSIIWTPKSIAFYVNGVYQYTYRREGNAGAKQWPFDKPFYLILNQSGGAGWPGAIDKADLPFVMEVDWVKIYKPINSNKKR